jgi:hypothetical protein
MSWWPARRSASMTAAPGPASYAQWSLWFDEFALAGNDEALFIRATSGALPWSAGTAERLSERAGAALAARLDAAGLGLQSALGRCRTAQDVERAVLDARRCLAMLERFAALSCWPATLTTQLSAIITETAADLQKNLLRSAAADRTGRLAMALRRTPVDALDRVVVPREVSPSTPPPATGRRILL